MGKLNNCEGCHVKDGFYPVNAAVVAGTTMDANDKSTFADDAVTSPNAAVCSSCHTSDLARAHIDQNGGYFEQTGVKDAVTGKMIAGADIETCDVCHGQGRSADLRVMHEIDTFKYNK